MTASCSGLTVLGILWGSPWLPASGKGCALTFTDVLSYVFFLFSALLRYCVFLLRIFLLVLFCSVCLSLRISYVFLGSIFSFTTWSINLCSFQQVGPGSPCPSTWVTWFCVFLSPILSGSSRKLNNVDHGYWILLGFSGVLLPTSGCKCGV